MALQDDSAVTPAVATGIGLGIGVPVLLVVACCLCWAMSMGPRRSPPKGGSGTAAAGATAATAATSTASPDYEPTTPARPASNAAASSGNDLLYYRSTRSLMGATAAGGRGERFAVEPAPLVHQDVSINIDVASQSRRPSVAVARRLSVAVTSATAATENSVTTATTAATAATDGTRADGEPTVPIPSDSQDAATPVTLHKPSIVAAQAPVLLTTNSHISDVHSASTVSPPITNNSNDPTPLAERRLSGAIEGASASV